jgi:G3E family GTPase
MRSNRPLDWTVFGVWLSMLLSDLGEDVLRVKGLLNVLGSEPGDDRTTLLIRRPWCDPVHSVNPRSR